MTALKKRHGTLDISDTHITNLTAWATAMLPCHSLYICWLLAVSS